MLGPLSIRRAGQPEPLALPQSRKVRALVAYLALAPRAQSRRHLCELLWDTPNDPRSELRWCLSKIRGLVDDPGTRRRVHTRDDAVQLELGGVFVDVHEVAAPNDDDPRAQPLGVERLRGLVELFHGEFLEGLESDSDSSTGFGAWLNAQRRRLHGRHCELLEQLAKAAPADEQLSHVERWLQLAPFERRGHELLLTELARRGRLRDAEQHLQTTAKRFAAEGLDVAPLRAAWQSLRTELASATGSSSAVERGTREVAPESSAPAVAATSSLLAPPAVPDASLLARRRASIAVLPFVDAHAGQRPRGGAADAIVHDVITGLARMRSLFVIAQGTVFALHERRVGPEEAGRLLNVDYVLSGSLAHDERITVRVELVETTTARIVWADTFHRKAADMLSLLAELADQIVASISHEIETHERNLALLRPPSSLDAWQAHHRGLWHMYRFSREDNALAQHFFALAVRLDPTFARAYSGLSFTHFQNAFQGWAEREPETARAFDAAGQSMMIDDRDPSARWAMGRALWLRGAHDQALIELERAVELSPNFALAHYTLAFIHCQAGDPTAAISSADQSHRLSPYDPLLFGTLASRAIALARLGRFEEAAQWATRGAAQPNAHVHIIAIAAYSLALAGALETARTHAASVLRLHPDYGLSKFMAAFRFDAQAAALFREAAARLGMLG